MATSKQTFDDLMNENGLPSTPSTQSPSKQSALGVLGRGILNGASMGLADEAMDGLHNIVPSIPNGDSLRKNMELDQQQYPKTSTVANLGGGLIDALIPYIGEAKLGSLLTQGALSGVGNSNTLTDPTKSWGDTATAGTEGAATNAILGTAIKSLANGVVNKQTIGKLYQNNPLEMGDTIIGRALRSGLGSSEEGRNLSNRYADIRLNQFNNDFDKFRTDPQDNAELGAADNQINKVIDYVKNYRDINSDLNTPMHKIDSSIDNTNMGLKRLQNTNNVDDIDNYLNSDFYNYVNNNGTKTKNVINNNDNIQSIGSDPKVDINSGTSLTALSALSGHPYVGAIAGLLQSGLGKSILENLSGSYAKRAVRNDIESNIPNNQPSEFSLGVIKRTPNTITGVNAGVNEYNNQKQPIIKPNELHDTLRQMGYTDKEIDELK